MTVIIIIIIIIREGLCFMALFSEHNPINLDNIVLMSLKLLVLTTFVLTKCLIKVSMFYANFFGVYEKKRITIIIII